MVKLAAVSKQLRHFVYFFHPKNQALPIHRLSGTSISEQFALRTEIEKCHQHCRHEGPLLSKANNERLAKGNCSNQILLLPLIKICVNLNILNTHFHMFELFLG